MNMKNIGLLLLFVSLLCSCDTKQDWYDSGICSPYHDCSIMEYLRGDTANWKLTVELIERAELTDLFEGNDPNYKEITFLPRLLLRYFDTCGIRPRGKKIILTTKVNGDLLRKKKVLTRNDLYVRWIKTGVEK